MTNIDPQRVIDGLYANTESVDTYTKNLASSVDLLDEAEDRWEQVYDEVAQQLKAEMDEDDRKGDPAEHTIKSTTRRLHRDVYRNYRTAKRQVDKWQRLIVGTQHALSGRQTLNNALRDEVRASGAPKPSGPVYGGQRAA